MPGRPLLPQKRRTKHVPPFQLTDRDTAIIEAVHHYRMLERRQMEELARAHGEPLANLTQALYDTVQPSAPVQLVDWETIPSSPQYLYDARTQSAYP